MRKYTLKDIDSFEVIGNTKFFPSGDYSDIKSFGQYCSFGNSCRFGHYSSFGPCCSFGQSCRFGQYSSFGEYCSFGKSCRFGQYSSFCKSCSFGKYCRFGQRCSFGQSCRFLSVDPSILRSRLSDISIPDEITLELMRRDAWCHSDSSKFDEWAEGGPCPYGEHEIMHRKHSFKAKRVLWKPGPPQMKDYDLIMAISDAAGWRIEK